MQRFYCHTRPNAILLYFVHRGSTKVYWTYLLYMCSVYSALSAKWSLQSVPLIVLATPDFNQSDKQCRWCISQSKKEWGGSNHKIPARQPPGRTGDSAFRNVESNLLMIRFKRITTLANATWLLVKLQTSDSKGQTCWCQWVKCWPAGPLCPTSRGSTASWIKKKPNVFLKTLLEDT